MKEIPSQLLDGLTTGNQANVEEWWSGLAETDRSFLAELFDQQRNDSFFGSVPSDAPGPLPLVIGGKFVPRDDVAGWDEWSDELFDYLLCNPELVLLTPPVVRTFHICTRHEAARQVLKVGRVPGDFHCPLAAEDCPMQRLLAEAPLQAEAALQLFGFNPHSQQPRC